MGSEEDIRGKTVKRKGPRLQLTSLPTVPMGFKGFQNLKSTYLADTNITDDGLQHLMSNCSVLEFLGIVGCAMLTTLQISHPSNTLKHLHVYDCCLLQGMELNFGLVRLEYRGLPIVLSPPGTLLLTNMCIKLEGICTSLEYIFTKLRDNVPRLEVLNLKCQEYKMTTLPGELHEFVYLKHLILELTFESCQRGKTDILQFACLLVASPSLEKLEFHMWLRWGRERYRAEDGSLRSLPSQPHSHLRSVDITGFYGEKDRLELVLHILRDSVALESMKVDPSPVVAADVNRLGGLGSMHVPHFVDGYEVALEFLCSKDRRNVVHVAEPLAGLGVLRLGASPDIIERARRGSSPLSPCNSSAKASWQRVKRVKRLSRPSSSRGAS
ncbi:hypothetical protein TRIUR3_33958 [Triticum urartu]|uniref:At1g61320/AtMIF1 LRR domain-containing protein n=2 Tax=Triticum urartu TaxID=4572 RepID=M8A6R3_TRIUA|nr:hypothetical protein TRIUR3_33958 [Triticum urartu]